jgi:hypothetical protein
MQPIARHDACRASGYTPSIDVATLDETAVPSRDERKMELPNRFEFGRDHGKPLGSKHESCTNHGRHRGNASTMPSNSEADKTVERVKGIEPSYSAWKAAALPLSYTRGSR